MEVLSSFAINIAASIALSLLKKARGGVDNEIKQAFTKALIKWSPNKTTRNNFRESLKSKLKKNLANLETAKDMQFFAKDKFEKNFYAEFDKAIAEFQSAYNYLKEIKDRERYNDKITLLSKINTTSENTEKKVDNLGQDLSIVKKLVENNLPQSNKLLETEWIRQIALYQEGIEHLKPISSLKHLKALEESFTQHDIRPSKPLQSYLEFLKAQSYELTGQTEKAYKSYIKAKNLNPYPLEIRVKSCISYANLNQEEKSIELANEILKEDEFNPTAWAVKVILSEELDLKKRIEIVPRIVIKDSTFLRIVYYKTITNAKVQNKLHVYHDNGFFRDLAGYHRAPLTYSNYNDRLFFIETTIQQWISNFYLDFISIAIPNRSNLEKVHQILDDFLKQLSDSEIKTNEYVLSFYLDYLDHVLYGNNQALKTLESLFPKIKMEKDLLGVMLANCLQLTGEIDKALEIINSFETKSLELTSLELFCLGKKGNTLGYSITASDFLRGITRINTSNCSILINIIDALSEFGKLDDFDFDQFFKNTESFPPSLKILVLNFFKILKKENVEDTLIDLKSIESEIINLEASIRFYLPFCYHLLNEFDSAIDCFEKYLKQDIESIDFYYYILTIYQSKTNHKKLLHALENWRKNCSFKESFLRIEIESNQRLQNWQKCMEIAEYALTVKPNDEWFLTAIALSISRLDTPEKTKQLDDILNKLLEIGISDFNHIRLITNILIENKNYQKALDLLFERAKDPDDIPARIEYFLAFTKIPNDYFEIPKIVDKRLYVRYSRKGKIENVRVVEGNVLASKIIGTKVGDRISVQDPITRELDTIEILGIMDKYQFLSSQIIKQVENSPFSGLPIHSFELPSNDPDSLVKKLITYFGADGSKDLALIKEAISEYYDYKISLTEVIIRGYRSNFFGGYFDLAHNKKGISQTPLKYYTNIILPETPQFVLDMSSLIILHQLTKSIGKEYKDKFVVANGIVHYIKSLLKEESNEPNETISADITLEGIKGQKMNSSHTSHNISYYLSILEWIDSHCEIEINESKLDYENALELDSGEGNVLFQLFVENVAILNENDSKVLLSDDSVYNKIFPLSNGKLISTELYIKSRHGEIDKFLYEFVKNRYIGLSTSKELLLSEYRKKRKGEPNFFEDCLNNCSLKISGTLRSAKTVVEFLQEIALDPLIDDTTFYHICNSAFIILLSNQKNTEVFISTKAFIEGAFQLLGEKRDIIFNSFADAISIIKNA